MPYIGNQPGTGVRNRFIYTATASQTTFSGADDNGKTLKYADSDFVDVYLNGICLVPVTDYTSTSKTSIVLTQAASLNDTLEVIAYDIATIADTVSKADGGTFEANVTFANGADLLTASAGTDNVRLGEDAGASIASGGNQNVLIGKDAGTANTTASNNVAIGYQALDANTTGGNSVAIGSGALGAQTTGDRNIGIGTSAGEAITTGQGSIAIGHQALASATTGDDNIAIGADSPTVNAALEANTTGLQNVAVGGGALAANTTANEGAAVGYKALEAVTTGFGNTAIGGNAGKAVTTTDRSTFLGNLAGSTTTGRANTFLGSDSGYLVTSGAKNTILGRFNGNQAGLDIRTSDNNIVLSDGSGNPRVHIDSNGRLGIAYTGPTTRLYVYGEAGNDTAVFRNGSDAGNGISIQNAAGTEVGSINWASSSTSFNTSSDYRLKENVVDLTGAITRIKQLEPKRFNFIADADTTVDGFLAHEVQSTVPEAITGTHNEVDDDNNPVYQGIDQSKLVPLLTAALQEAIAKIETLETENTAIKARLDALEAG